MMAWVLLALGLVMLVEGLAYVLAPSLIERVLEVLRTMPESTRRLFGALVFVTGLICVWLAFFIGL